MKQTVLIVEDEPWQAEVFARQLQEYTVVLTHNGYEAIEAIDKGIPDVIVLDMLLSGSTAMTLIHELKSHDDSTSVPIILVTNLADSLPADVAQRYGISEVLDKTTLQRGDILRAVQKVTS